MMRASLILLILALAPARLTAQDAAHHSFPLSISVRGVGAGFEFAESVGGRGFAGQLEYHEDGGRATNVLGAEVTWVRFVLEDAPAETERFLLLRYAFLVTLVDPASRSRPFVGLEVGRFPGAGYSFGLAGGLAASIGGGFDVVVEADYRITTDDFTMTVIQVGLRYPGSASGE